MKGSGKEDPLERLYIILIKYECHQQNQPRNKIFRDRLMNKCVNECMNEYYRVNELILVNIGTSWL